MEDQRGESRGGEQSMCCIPRRSFISRDKVGGVPSKAIVCIYYTSDRNGEDCGLCVTLSWEEELEED